jgi:transposase
VKNTITYVGIDAHKKDLFIAMLVGNQATPVAWTAPNEPNAVRRLVRKLEREAPGRVRACDEAGPCGYALQRQMTTARVSCQVIAPALIPRKPGERIKTNPRDARKLAELFRADLLTEVRPPTLEDEAVRDLCRARDDAREDLQRSRHRLGKLLLRKGLHYSGRNWTPGHQRWIDSLDWAQRPSASWSPITCWRSSNSGAPQRTRWPAGGDRRDGAVPGTRRVVAVLSWHRHLDGDADPGRVA